MTFSLHPKAAADLTSIVAFYKKEASTQIAGRFIDEFERVVNLLVEKPGFGSPFDLPRRSYPLRTFPYAVIYRHTTDGLRILAVRHHSRHPNHGLGRH